MIIIGLIISLNIKPPSLPVKYFAQELDIQGASVIIPRVENTDS